MLRNLFQIIPCHRMRSRSLVINGQVFPLCARCTGILAGYLFFPFLFLFHIHISLLIGIILNVPMVADGWTQKKKLRVSNNPLRLATGVISGFGQSVIIVSITTYIVNTIIHLT